MISIIICSRNDFLLKKITNNISETIGVKHELIPINNCEGLWGISAAYNEGAKGSKYDLLIFVHEDVIFHSTNWGEVVIETLKDRLVGLLGVAGAVIKPELPIGWMDVPQDYYRANAISGWGEQKKTFIFKSDRADRLGEVVVLDGMFLCMRKDVWEKFHFDEKVFSGFNLYDLDISMAIGSRYKLFVSHDILIEHLSPGNFSVPWYEDSKKFVQKWKHSLPRSCVTITRGERLLIQHHAYIKTIGYLTEFRHFTTALLIGYLKLFWYRPLSRLNFVVIFTSLSKFFR
jgi:Glycosyltransferase like family